MSTTTTAQFLSSASLAQSRPVIPANRHHAASATIVLLTQRLAAGDEEAFREFHSRYFDRLYQFLLVVARGNEDEARETLQDTLVRVVRHARRFEDEEAFWCWLKAVARNAARDGGRKRRRYLVLLSEFTLRRHVDRQNGTDSEQDQLRALLRETLTELSDRDRYLVEGKYLLGHSIKELANSEGVTEKAVESRLWRLRRELRARLLKGINEL